MKPETIKAIFTNLLFVIGVILLIVGFVQGTRTVVKLATFESYPLDSWEETKCEQAPYLPVPIEGGKTAAMPQDIEKMAQDCKESLVMQRKVKQTEDIVSAVTMLVSGAALVYFFRKYILK